jgi:predicted MFS family arabinose efflux permease
MAVLIASVVIAAPFAPLVFLGHIPAAVAGMVLWGAGMGAQETILRAVIATLIPPDRRASAYGLFNANFGLAWFLGSALMGYLYDLSPIGLAAFSVLAHVAAIPLLMGIGRQVGIGRQP